MTGFWDSLVHVAHAVVRVLMMSVKPDKLHCHTIYLLSLPPPTPNPHPSLLPVSTGSKNG